MALYSTASDSGCVCPISPKAHLRSIANQTRIGLMTAQSLFDGTFENRMRLEPQRLPNKRRLTSQSGCTHFLAKCDFNNDG
jgi:hypothetical protein